MIFSGKANEYLEVVEVGPGNCDILENAGSSELSLIWFSEDDNILVIDGLKKSFNNNQILCLTEFHKLEVLKMTKARLIRFNRAFYCILHHDTEVSCKGLLFFGNTSFPMINPTSDDLKILNAVWEMLLIEMESRDNLQLEMLQMMLKRLLILCTRIYKRENINKDLEPNSIDIIREFNFLVEMHFKNYHGVDQYAEMLNRSPKTLSNTFRLSGNKSPLQFINNRIMVESRRLLAYTDKSISEIALELGFTDIQSFSRFFKKNEMKSPTEYRSKSPSGKIDNYQGNPA
ncbi:helix-turn-helix domain-containing protein [Marinigracilibium pacificum]|uniref:Helix-turn-helix domain-containing protein n=1 Tax=Marinigracilibium pacificum TaxID=2729599 RepID=A0A848J5W6_9BACT|nr:helix-turn-helix domain-containing protein [Marinigracilibium pacificum]NMM48522.1 helix-turn-helix domain-containing protein [Marinigracilibium pacificum]